MGRKRGERSGGGGGGKGGSSTILCLLCLVVMVGCFVYLFARYQRRKFLQPTPENEKDMNIGGRRYRELESEPIDIVYTWVNGSDPRHARSVLETKIRIGLQEVNEKNETVDAATRNRFQDNNELRYSLRSIEKFAGWVRNIYLVTNGQVPNWLNLDHPRIQVVSHEEIFPNKSHLPTFSSPAIEVHLHRIPGLSEKWIYFNDDVVLGNDIWPSDFYSEATGQTLYLSWEIPNCAPGCLQNWIGDSYCDRACDSPECDYDGGDCLGDNPNSVRGYDYEYDYEYEDTSMYREEYYYGQGEEVVGPSSCVYGCSDFYLGDHYCDSVCNCPECGYDGGDCGMELVFANLDGIVLSSPSSPDIFEIPNGALAFYVNFSELIGSESKIKEGSFDNKAMVRSAAISSRYKSLVVTLIEFTSPKEEEKEEEEEKGEIEERELEEGELEEGEIVEEEKEGDEVDWMDEENRVAEFVILYEKDDTTYELNFHIRSNAFASSSLPKKTESEQLILLSHGDEIHKGHEHDESKGDREGARELLFFSVEKKKEREEVSGGQISYPIEKETFPINIDQVDQVELEKEEQQLRELLKNQQEQREHQLQQLHLLQQRVRHERERIDSRQPQQRWGKNSQQLPPQQQQPQQRKQTQQVERSFPPTQQGPPSQQGPQQLGLTSQELQQQRYLRQQQRQQRYRSHPMPGSQQGQNLQQEQRGPPQQQQRGSPQQQQQRGSPQQQQQRGSPQQQQQRGPPQQQRGPMPQQQQRGQQDPRQPQPQSLGEQDQHYQRFRGEHLLNEGHQPISDPRQKHLPPPSQQQQQQQQQRQQQDQGTRNSPQRYPEQRYYQQQQSQQQQSKQQQQQSQQQQQRKEEIGEEESKKRRTGRKLNDIYGTSLKFVNSLFDKTFGKAKDIRKVPAHMPHFVQTRVMEDLQSMFPTQYEETSSHPFRQGNDIQMMFAYKYFIVHRWEDFELYDALRTIDTNQDGILNANELRTLGIFCFGSPLQDSNFEEMIIAIGVAKGTIHIDEEGNTDKSWQKYYNHYDQDLEKVANALWVTFRDIAITEELPDLLEDFFQKKPKYKSRIEGTDDVAFLMISEQDTEIVGKLDGIRRDRQKFLCLNDDMNHSDPKSDVTKKALTDLYDAILPLPSAFELPDGVQNPSLYMDELKAIREGREENLFQTFIVMGIFVVAFGILIFLLFPKTSNRVLFSAKALKV